MNESNEPAGGGGSGRFIPTERRKEASTIRRSGEERREDEGAFEGGDKRDPSERREAPERRNMGLDVPCKTSGTIDALEDWLEENCHHDWRVVLQKVDLNQGVKHLLVMFETEADRNLFLGKYLQRDQ